jgi:predicted O-methyltransferase YrrM
MHQNAYLRGIMVFRFITYVFFSLARVALSHSPRHKRNLEHALSLIKVKNNDLKTIRAYRKSLLNNKETVPGHDLGAGARKNGKNNAWVGKVAKRSGSTLKSGMFLYKMVAHFKPQAIIELGTSLGIGTLCLALADKATQVRSIEGNPYLKKAAESLLLKYGLDNVLLTEGDFDLVFEECIQGQKGKKMLVFIDGNHKMAPTLKYFYLCLKHCGKGSVIIIDDINWSDEMARTWQIISNKSTDHTLIHYFQKGIVLIEKEDGEQYENKIVDAYYKLNPTVDENIYKIGR